ncbi:unnamed protein product [Nippostrongylus brasiliensis]|uniref:TIR domain-containing protein n=1 Tax=Nippostrongylus brasiliensis TaxID=27835 RepID=A0A0N4Y1I5_NIPBR|nr:unnamed protein product [Nippostrongylus brasiliensis]
MAGAVRSVLRILLVILNIIPIKSDSDCNSMHSRTKGINLVCSARYNLNHEFVFGFLEEIQRAVNLPTARFWIAASIPLGAAATHVNVICMSVLISVANWKILRFTAQFIQGLAQVNVTELRIFDVDETATVLELAKYTPHLVTLELSAKTRRRVDVTKVFRHLKLLESLRVVNLDLQFPKTRCVQASPWIRSIVHIHIENSSLSELPAWMASAEKLHTLSLKSLFFIPFCHLRNMQEKADSMETLRSAKLSGNQISDVGKHMLLSSALYDIDISHNKIEVLASHTFALCSELRVLDLSYNPLGDLPHRPFVRNSRLKWLKLSHTKIKTISPENFVGLTSLKSLTLSFSPIHAITPFAFLPMKSLKTLDLEATNITVVPAAVTQNCALTHPRAEQNLFLYSLNLANNMLHRRASFPPEVVALLSRLTLFKLDGNPLTASLTYSATSQEFPPALFLLSTDNFRLIRQLMQTMASLPVWIEEPCTPYYWALHLRNSPYGDARSFISCMNRSQPFRNLVSPWSERRMEQEHLSFCREQYEWMIQGVEIYRDLEKNSGVFCLTNSQKRILTDPSSISEHEAEGNVERPQRRELIVY